MSLVVPRIPEEQLLCPHLWLASLNVSANITEAFHMGLSSLLVSFFSRGVTCKLLVEAAKGIST